MAVLAGGWVVAAHPPAPAAARGIPHAPGFEFIGALRQPEVVELSGLAASRREQGLYWSINDSGNPAELIALVPGKAIRGRVAVTDVFNNDWEDIVSFEQDGERWLAIADTGDNFSVRSEVQVILVPEPDPRAGSVHPARVLQFTYADGPRDVESIAVDVPGRRLLLIDKSRHPVGMYALPLDGADVGRVAERIADLPELVPTPPPRVRSISSPRWRGSTTSMALSDDGRRLLVLTYESVSAFARQPGQDWPEAVRHPVVSVRVPPISGLESIVIEPGGKTALIATEGPVASFFRWTGLPAP